VTPGFRTVVRNKQKLPDHPYSMTIRNSAGSSVTILSENTATAENGRTTYSHATAYSPSGPFSYLGDTNVRDAENKAMLRLSENLSSVRVNLAQVFGERRQTAGLLADTATRIVSAASALKRGRFDEFVSSLSIRSDLFTKTKYHWARSMKTPPSKRIAGHWLEYTYGWKPLLMDVFDSIEYLGDRITQDLDHGKLVGSARSVAAQKLRFPDYNFNGHVGVTNRVRFVAHYRIDNGGLKIVAAQTGIANPALLAWELLPYSFVVDWFLPVGTYLESLTTYTGFILTGGTKSVRQKATVHKDFTRNTIVGSDRTTISGASYHEEFRYNRTLLTSWPEYALRFKSPIGGEPLARLATAVSLLRVLFK